MNPQTILVIVIAGVSILAFQNPQLRDRLLLYPYGMTRRNDQWYRAITHAFVHADWMHLLFNMIALWSFGNAVYNCFTLCTARPVFHFFMMYFCATLFAAIPDLFKQRNNRYYASLGASGAVSAVVFCSILFNPWGMIFIFVIPCPGILFGVAYLVYSHYMSRKSDDHISHDAHFYGAIFGLIYPVFVNPDIYKVFIHRLI